MSPTLSIEEVRTLEGFEALRDSWNGLTERADSLCLTSTFPFAYTWWKYRSYGNTLFILLVKEEGRLVGIAPLMISDVDWGIVHTRKVSFMSARYLESDFMAEAGRRKECIRLATQHALRTTGCHYMEFCGIPEESGSLPVLRELAEEMGFRFSRSFHSAGCFIPIGETWESFLKGKTASFRKNMRHYEKKLSMKGRLETVRVRSTAEPQKLVKMLMEVDRHSWKVDWATQPENGGWMAELLTRCNENEWLDLFLLELDGKPIAYLLLIRHSGKAYAMFTSYNLDQASDSPGLVCFSTALRQLFREHDLSEVDFLSSYWYLRRWTDHLRSRYLVTLYPGGASGQMMRLSRGALHRTRSIFSLR